MGQDRSFIKLVQIGEADAGIALLLGRLAGENSGDNIAFFTHGNSKITLPLVSPEPGTGAAAAGEVGELLETVVASGSGVNLTNGVAKSIAVRLLSPGDWNVFGHASVIGVSGTTMSVLLGGTSLTTDTLEEENQFAYFNSSFTLNANICGFSVPPRRVSIAAATNVYLVVSCAFAGSTMKGFGRISARRAR